METKTFEIPGPVLFEPNPHFADPVNRNIIQSEIEGGVYLRDVMPGSVLYIQTRNRVYKLVVLGDDAGIISGHQEFCPEPQEVRILGCTWGGSMLKSKFLGRGMHLEFVHPVHNTILTSRIVDIRTEPEA